MKIEQDNKFTPILITLESKHEAKNLHEVLEQVYSHFPAGSDKRKLIVNFANILNEMNF